MLTKIRFIPPSSQTTLRKGKGWAHIEGCAVFVPNAIAGELCDIQITKAAKTWAAGRIYKILEVSPHRVNRACPQSKLCGGCAFQHMDYQEECRLKAERGPPGPEPPGQGRPWRKSRFYQLPRFSTIEIKPSIRLHREGAGCGRLFTGQGHTRW